MALQEAYKQFLAAPNSGALAADASLNYITTTTSYTGPTEIITHLSKLRNQVKKKKEDFLDVVEGPGGLAAELDTTLEFINSGASYLPGMDDNFLADRTVSLPIIHFVAFDAEGKIAQIRLSWDQGSLLKQLDVIGRTGRNWPIRDSSEQLRLVTQSVNNAGKSAAATAAVAGTSAVAPKAVNTVAHSRANSTNVLRDPHASLALFASREEADVLPAPIMSPYAGTRPRQRSFTEILGDEPAEEEDTPASPSRGRERSASPHKAIAPKIGAGKNFAPPRLFDVEDEDADNDSTGDPAKPVAPKAGGDKKFAPSRLFETEEDEASSESNAQENAKSNRASYMPHPTKYQHFDFADGSDPQDAPAPGPSVDEVKKSKHDSQWDFSDFVTPLKAKTKALRHQDVHWGNNDDEEEVVEEDSPVQKPQPAKPRRDAETHFEFQDDGLPSGDRPPSRPRGATHNTGLGLYQNNLYSEDGVAPTPGQEPRALGNITNLKDRRKDFESHFVMTDESPRVAPTSQAAAKISDDRAKAVRMMEANWASFDESPSQKENKPVGRAVGRSNDGERIAIAGDGMGGRKGTGGRGWGIGDESDDEKQPRPVPPKKQSSQKPSSGFSWDF